MYFPDTLNETSALAKILMKVYLIENSKANMLIKTDIFILHKFLLDYNF